jgi:hypothetical protein
MLLLIAATIATPAALAAGKGPNSPYDEQAVSKGEKPEPVRKEECRPATSSTPTSSGNKEAQIHPGMQTWDCLPAGKMIDQGPSGGNN